MTTYSLVTVANAAKGSLFSVAILYDKCLAFLLLYTKQPFPLCKFIITRNCNKIVLFLTAATAVMTMVSVGAAVVDTTVVVTVVVTLAILIALAFFRSAIVAIFRTFAGRCHIAVFEHSWV